MYNVFLRLSQGMAILGGAMLSLLIVLTCVSVTGRSLNGILHSDAIGAVMPGFAAWLLSLGIGPINGDFELIEAGVAFAIFAFLPLCHISAAHATVDVFTSMLSERTNRILRSITEVVFAAVLVLIAVQLFSGMQSKIRSGQTTLLLEYPVWWGYALSMIGAGMAALISVYIAAMRVLEAWTNQAILPSDAGAEH